ncbi:type IV pilin protein [Pseudomonas citronellolis]|nr:type IV pilin protein [Pseudomonas citronellolis]
MALPSYQSYVRRAACEDAKSVLVGAASQMERFRAQNNTYSGASLGGYAASPVDGSSKDTNIAITASDATSYTLTATPTSGGRLKGKGTLTITSTGARGGTGALANTWGSCSGI